MSAQQPNFTEKPTQSAPYDINKLNSQDVNSLREVAINHAGLLDNLAGAAGGSLLAVSAGIKSKAWGDSVTETPDFPTKGYAYLLGAVLGGTFTNYGVSGSTIYEAISSVYTKGELLPGRDYLATMGKGINDWRSYQDAGGNAYFLRSIRLFLELCFAKNRYLAGDAAVTYSAGWSASSFSAGTQILSPAANILHGSGPVTVSVAVTDADQCTVVLWSSGDSFQSDAVNVYVDNVLYTTANPKALVGPAANNGSAAIFVRFTRGNHVVKIENANGGGNIFFDYALVRRPASEASAPALVYSTLDISDALRNGLTQTQWDAMNARTRAVVDLYQRQGYPVRWVNLNIGYDYTQPATSDGVHPAAVTHSGALLPNVLSYIKIV